jgi:hypothetical protein
VSDRCTFPGHFSSVMAQFGSVVAQLWLSCGSVVAHFGSVMDQFGSILDHLGSIFPKFCISFYVKSLSCRDKSDLVILRKISNT